MHTKPASLLTLVGLVAGLFASAATAEPLNIRIQYGGSVPGQFGPILEAKTDLYRHYGKSYTIQSVSIRGSGPALTALAANEVHISALSYESFARAVITANLDVRAIADVLGNNMKGSGDDYFIARKGEIKSIADLKGRPLAIISHGSAPHTSLKRMLEKHGMKESDVQLVEVGVPAMLPALESKRVDLAFVTGAFTVMAEKSGKYETVFAYTDPLGPTQSLVWVAKADWIEKNRPALVDFMEDHIRLRHWLFDPANREDMLQLIAKVTKRPADLHRSWVYTKRDHYRDPNARPDLALLQKNIDDAKEMGLLQRSIDVSKYSDMSLVEDALMRINN